MGFKNISIDLIYGAPGQTPEEWAKSLQRAIDLYPEHISVYGLTIEPQTNFARRFQKGQLKVPPETDQAEMYMYAIDQLEAAGYTHYEISNFARRDLRRVTISITGMIALIWALFVCTFVSRQSAILECTRSRNLYAAH